MAEMRRYKREVQDTRQIRRLLEECQVLRIGTMDQEGMFIVPVNYGGSIFILPEKEERYGPSGSRSG